MRILAIATSRIWNARRLRNTAVATRWLVKVLSDRKNIWNAFGARLRNGIEALMGVNGIPRMVAEHGLASQRSTRFAFAADRTLRPVSSEPFSALVGASSAAKSGRTVKGQEGFAPDVTKRTIKCCHRLFVTKRPEYSLCCSKACGMRYRDRGAFGAGEGRNLP